MSNLKLIKCNVSKDSQRIYFLSSFNKTIDGLTAVTYNISASDCYNVLTKQLVTKIAVGPSAPPMTAIAAEPSVTPAGVPA